MGFQFGALPKRLCLMICSATLRPPTGNARFVIHAIMWHTMQKPNRLALEPNYLHDQQPSYIHSNPIMYIASQQPNYMHMQNRTMMHNITDSHVSF